MKTHNHTRRRNQKYKPESENPAKQIASWNLADLNVQSSTRGYEEPKPNQIFGTDIHQHTIEFSKNTRT
ncbi:hypothetical protein, partial [Nocardia grenadensis]|uniref:hypothetical protein n=1 Tax=Nocardia grenadensis TaxID=931537 RepID=UPI001C3FC9BE